MEGCHQFITRCVCHSFLFEGRTPHTLPLLQHGVPPMGDSSPQTSTWVLPMGPARSMLQHRPSMGSQPPLGIPLLWYGVFHKMQVDTYSTVDLHGLQGHSLPHHGLLHRLQGNLCSSAWNTSSSPFFTDLGVSRAVSFT